MAQGKKKSMRSKGSWMPNKNLRIGNTNFRR